MKRWLHSAPFDLGLVLGPPIAAVLCVLALPSLQSGDLPDWGWLVFVVGIDVAHVWSSLYRTYLDPAELARRRSLYLGVPLVCWVVGVTLHSIGPAVFWRVLAYLAVWHFLRQQFGFVMLYRHRAGERDRFGFWIDKLAIYAAMLYPLAFWHASGDRAFAWFMPGDFVRLPSWTSSLAGWCYGAALGLFVLRQLTQLARGRAVNAGKIGIVGSTAAVWYAGIVAFNSDFAFTVTNVVAHGVPYFALVWLYGRRRWSPEPGWRRALHRPVLVGGWLALLLGLAYLEEGAWDLFIWRDHPHVFGGLELPFAPSRDLLNVLVPLLVLPQAVHYVLDAYLWRFDGSNPGIREHLFAERESANASPIGESMAHSPVHR